MIQKIQRKEGIIMALTIQWLLEQSKDDRQFICLAGNKGIQNPITGINIMDNPDTVPWLKNNELILSTGYIFTSTDLYKTIIQNLHDQGCSGLGIKVHRYMESIPKEMIEQANALDFPIFSIPFSSFAPKQFDTRIEKPCVNPINNPNIAQVIQSAPPIEAKASTPTNCPTIIVSTIV